VIHILTLKVGTKYSVDYVNRLYNSIKRNTTKEFKLYCYTEDKKGLHSDINVIQLNNPDEFKLQWHKLKFHKINFGGISTGEKCLILDIDWIITGNIDDILGYDLPERTFGCFERWWSNLRSFCKINGGFQMFYMGDTHQLWTTFKKAPEHWQEYYIKEGLASGPVNGEQNFIDTHITLDRSWLPMEWFAKHHEDEYFKIQLNWHMEVNKKEPYFMSGEFCDTVKMVHFSNADNNMELIQEDWINDYWY
jgi:hypothetical protein